MRYIAVFLVVLASAGCQYQASPTPSRITVTVSSVTLNHRQTLLHGTDAAGNEVQVNCGQGARGRRIQLGVPQEFNLVYYSSVGKSVIDCSELCFTKDQE